MFQRQEEREIFDGSPVCVDIFRGSAYTEDYLRVVQVSSFPPPGAVGMAGLRIGGKLRSEKEGNQMKKRVVTMHDGVIISDEKEGEYHEA